MPNRSKRWDRVVFHSAVGVLGGFILLHPISMVIHDGFAGQRGVWESVTAAFSLHHVPMAVYFVLLGGLGGMLYGLYDRRLAILRDRLADLSMMDELTAVHNRRYFNDQLEQEMARFARHRVPVSLLLADVDNLKAINDSLGHLHGDAALKCVGRGLRENARSSDVGARIGGDEFAVLMPRTSKAEAARLAERLRASVAGCKEDGANGVSLSIGVAECPADAAGGAELLRSADRALYEAKTTGRNAVRVASPLELSV